MFRASARALRKDEIRIPIMVVGAFLTLYLGLWSLLGTFSRDALSFVALLGLVGAWLRVSLPRKFQASGALRAFVVVALIAAVATAAWLLINVAPSVENLMSWMFGAAMVIGAFLIAATIGEGPGAL